ncbi:MAG: hypothetical protein FJX77_10730, partial [Armatimonadetes bacterium]|nr:hypothetical protein [Armatimonadota bacterium]
RARTDLLALEPEDLIALSNRGLVKRALAEWEAGSPTCELEENGEALTARWSDGIACVIPAGKGLADGRCTCPAASLCRHLLRTVLAYQHAQRRPEEAPDPVSAAQEEESDPAAASEATPAPAVRGEPWDPGEIPDVELERCFRATDLARARRAYAEEQVVELIRSARPTAQFHTLGCTVRFLVPGDLRYTRCDCAEAAPCVHVLLAVWAFRLLGSDRSTGVVCTQSRTPLPPREALDNLERALLELATTGLSGAPALWTDRVRWLEREIRRKGLVWPADILEDLLLQQSAYARRDARFDPRQVADLAGELLLRVGALRTGTGAAPTLFVRGSAADRSTEVGSTRLVGLGCGVELGRGGVTLSSYLQDVTTGAVVAVTRGFSDPARLPGADLPPFWRLGQSPVFQGATLASVGAGQILTTGGKRSARGEFSPGRSRISCNPQSFRWEELRAPVLVEDFNELQLRLGERPPACLLPRRLDANLWVCPMEGATEPTFSEPDQRIYCRLHDVQGGTAVLEHPFTSRGRDGADELLNRLRQQGNALRFVAGRAVRRPDGYRLLPLLAVFEQDGRRAGVQPWVDRLSGAAVTDDGPTVGRRNSIAVESSGSAEELIQGFLTDLREELGELWLLGLERREAGGTARWATLLERGRGLGFHRLLEPLGELVAEGEARRHRLDWTPFRAAGALLRLTALMLLADNP